MTGTDEISATVESQKCFEGGSFCRVATLGFGSQDLYSQYFDAELVDREPTVVRIVVVRRGRGRHSCSTGPEAIAQRFHRRKDALASLVTDTTHPGETPAPHGQEIFHLDDIDPVERIYGGRSESELRHDCIDGSAGSAELSVSTS